MSAPFSNLAPAEGLAPLLALSGMAYRAWDYTADEWKAKTGVDPRHFPQWFEVSPRNSFCALTRAGREALGNHFDAVRRNWGALGI